MSNQIATGFDFEPLPDGNVLIEFHDDQGTTINSQIITGDAFASVPMTAIITLVALRQGADAAKAIIDNLNAEGRRA